MSPEPPRFRRTTKMLVTPTRNTPTRRIAMPTAYDRQGVYVANGQSPVASRPQRRRQLPINRPHRLGVVSVRTGAHGRERRPKIVRGQADFPSKDCRRDT